MPPKAIRQVAFSMAFELLFHRDAEPALRRWRSSLGSNHEDRQKWYSILLRAMEDRLIQTNGTPPEAEPDHRVAPTVYRWQFTDELRVQYVLVDDAPELRGWWDLKGRLARAFRQPKRTAIVISLTLGRDRAAGESLHPDSSNS